MQQAGRRRGAGPAVADRLVPVAHRHDDQRRTATHDGLVVGARDRTGHFARMRRLCRPHRVVAGEPLEVPACEERPERQLPPVLLPDHDHERNPVVARTDDRVDGVAEAGRRVQVDEGRPPRPECVAARHPDDAALVQSEHELEVVGNVGEERDLARAGVPEDARHAEPPHDGERLLADRAHNGIESRQRAT